MTPPHSADPLVIAATRTLTGDAESKSSARRLLEILREEQPDQAGAALKSWDAHDAKKLKSPWITTFTLIVVGISTFMLVSGVRDLSLYDGVFRIPSIYRWENDLKPPRPGGFSQREKQLLKIHDSKQSTTAMAKSLWVSEPASAAYFTDYCATYFQERRLEGKPALPPDFLDNASRLAPGNAYFRYWAADVAAADAVVEHSLYTIRRALGTGATSVSEWKVMNEDQMARALAMLRECQNLSEFRSYRIEMIRQRIPLLQQSTHHEYDRSIKTLGMANTPEPQFRSLANVIAAKAWQLGDRGDTQGLLELQKDAEIYLRNISRTEPGLMIQENMIEMNARIILQSLADSTAKLGLAAESAEMQTQLDRLEKLNAARLAHIFEIEGQSGELKLSVIARSYLPDLTALAVHPPVLRDRDVKPGRMMEQTIPAQLSTYGICVLLAVSAGMALLYTIRSPRLIRDLSARIALLLRPADWIWLFIAGLLPFIYTMLITTLTTLGGSEANVMNWFIDLPYYDGVFLPIAQFAGMLLMMLIVGILAVRWMLGKRAAFFGFGKTPLWIGWIALISAAAFIPVLGWAVTTKSDPGLKVSWVLFVIPLGWIFLVVIRALTTGTTQLLHITTAALVLIPVYAGAIVLLLMTTPYFQWSRQYWFERDPMARLDVNYPSLTKFEYETSVQARKELREALGYDR